MKVDEPADEPIVPGISLSGSGQATIDASIQDTLFDLAAGLEEQTNLPVDVEHVVAALVLASRGGQVAADRPLSVTPAIGLILSPHVKSIFASHGGDIAGER